MGFSKSGRWNRPSLTGKGRGRRVSSVRPLAILNQSMGDHPSEGAALGGPKLEIVINRFDSGSEGIDEGLVTKALTQPARWKIPNDYIAVRRMQTSATPLTDEDSAIAQAIRAMAESVCGQPAIPKKKKGFSLF